MEKKNLNNALSEIEDRIQASMLSDEEKAAAKHRAREHVAAKRKEKAIDEAFKAALVEEERAYEPADQIVDIMIDLPKYAPFVRLDHVVYYHGLIYEVPRNKALTILDIQARSWEHQNEIEGKTRRSDEARGPRYIKLGPQHEGMALNLLEDLKQFTRL